MTRKGHIIYFKSEDDLLAARDMIRNKFRFWGYFCSLQDLRFYIAFNDETQAQRVADALQGVKA